MTEAFIKMQAELDANSIVVKILTWEGNREEFRYFSAQ
jgi:hypothetical protein